MNLEKLPKPVSFILSASLLVGGILLVAPFSPPQAALGGFIAILTIGLSAYIAIVTSVNVLFTKADELLPEVPVEKNKIDEDLKEQYINGEITDEEFENEVEKIMEKEQLNEK